MKIWFDTEFIEDGKTIDLLSIGMVREDGMQYYAENVEADLSRASPWVRDNVLPHLGGAGPPVNRMRIAHDVRNFVGTTPQFWAWYADYDWVVLCQLYGTMMELPTGWPQYCMDVKQLSVMLGDPFIPDISHPDAKPHNALWDALECRRKWNYLKHRGTLQI